MVLFLFSPAHDVSQPHFHDKERVLGTRLWQGHLLGVLLVVATPAAGSLPFPPIPT